MKKVFITFLLFSLLLSACKAEIHEKEYSYLLIEDTFIEPLKELNETRVAYFIKAINNLIDNYFNNNENIYYAIVPDKGYFLQDQFENKFDYSKMLNMLNGGINNAQYIAIFDQLTIADYYKTDMHWRQEKLGDVVNQLGSVLGFESNMADYKANYYASYLGNYGQSDERALSEELIYLTNDTIDNSLVINPDSAFNRVYDVERLNSKVAYDIYLSGANYLMTIENLQATSDKELIIVRDSFASSLVPLLIDHYKRIKLIDIRYIAPSLIEDYIDITGDEDVLFLYSTHLVNNSITLKIQ